VPSTLVPCIEQNQSPILEKTAFVTLHLNFILVCTWQYDNFGVFIYTSDPFIVIVMQS